jgi:hypothetical protein
VSQVWPIIHHAGLYKVPTLPGHFGSANLVVDWFGGGGSTEISRALSNINKK